MAERAQFPDERLQRAHHAADLRVPRIRHDEDAHRVSGGLGHLRRRALETAKGAALQDLQPAVEVLDQRRATLGPVTVIAVENAVDHTDLRVMDMAADHAVHVPSARFPGEHDLEVGDVLHRVLHPVLQVCQERPVRKSQDTPDAVDEPVAVQHHAVRPVTEPVEPARVADDAVEAVAVCDEEPPPVGSHVRGLGPDLDAGHVESVEFARGFVMVAGHEDHFDAGIRPVQELPDDCRVACRPVPGFLEAPAVDDVAGEIQRLGLDGPENHEQVLRPARPRAKMEVGDPQGAGPPGETDDSQFRNPLRQRPTVAGRPSSTVQLAGIQLTLLCVPESIS